MVTDLPRVLKPLSGWLDNIAMGAPFKHKLAKLLILFSFQKLVESQNFCLAHHTSTVNHFLPCDM